MRIYQPLHKSIAYIEGEELHFRDLVDMRTLEHTQIFSFLDHTQVVVTHYVHDTDYPKY